MFHRKAPMFDITDHPDILAALARMEQEAYARGRADSLAIARDYREEVRSTWVLALPGQDRELAGMDGVIERLEV